MGLVAIMFLYISRKGFSDALIQRPQLDDAHFDTAFWLMLGLGTGRRRWAATPLMVNIFSNLCSPIFCQLWRSHCLTPIRRCYTAMMRRQLQFRQLAIRSMLAYGSGFITALVMGTLGYGIYSLVTFFLVSRILSAVLVIVVSRSLPGLKISREAFHDITGFGKHRVAQNIVAYVSLQSPRMIIGILLGPVALGLYSMAERLATALNNGISGVLQRVAFPVLSSLQNDRESFDRAMQDFLTFANLHRTPHFHGNCRHQ
jgi:PST family polysaccharide transporter